MTRKRVGVLISGRGSNLQALVDAAQAPDYPAEILLVISNVPGAQGLARADEAGIAALAINHKDFASREDFDTVLNETLKQAEIDILCNAGFLRLHTPGFVRAWYNRHLNIHPSLLPAFKGLHTHERVLAEGVKISGCSVHFVREEMDTGPIVAQAAVPVLEGDTPDRLAARVLEAEHHLYPHALGLVASGAVRVEGKRVIGTTQQYRQSMLFSPALSGALY